MIRSIASVSLGGTLKEKIYAVAAAGFDALELTESVLAYSEMQPSEIRQLLDETGLTVSLFHSIAEVEAVPEEVFAKTLARLDRKFELMNALGATLLGVPSNAGLHALDDQQLAATQLAMLAEKASGHGIRVGYEPRASGRHVSRYADAWKIVSLAANDNLGLVLDSFEILAKGDDPAAIANIPGDKIFLAQLADAPILSVDIETLGRHFRCLPGEGSLDVTGFAGYVLDSGYDGAFSLEILNDVLRAAPVRSAALDGYRSLTFVEERLFRTGRKAGRSTFAKEAPPPEQEDEEIRFVEFAVDSEDQRELAVWLQSLGFRYAGKHRSKDVALYRQGDVFMILNAGADTFPHYYHHLHGTSACAIGLEVSDREAMLARAELYRYKIYNEPAGSQEYEMPAVRSPDGSLIHLLDRSYDPATDFILDDRNLEEDVFIKRIDHLARAVPIDQFDAWVLYYRALLGLNADASRDLSDPHGVVHSRAMHDTGNRLRLPLTFSDSSKTVVARSLSSFGGAGINQIAFESDDIFAAVAVMRNAGARLLNIPPNYFHELAENRGVPPKLAEKLQDASVLYDRDAHGGEFFHVYTEVFNGRFFFEVVQRVNGYDRYGERNAPVRMAAQARSH